MTTSAGLPSGWRWRRCSVRGWATWEALLPGALGQDGGVVLVGHRAQGDGRCQACGRRAWLWHASLVLPPPFPIVDEAEAGGCSRDHAVRAVPSSWEDVASAFAIVALALRDDDQRTVWHERLAAMREREAHRARWLAGQLPEARRLALRLWSGNETLSLADTQAVVTGILATSQSSTASITADRRPERDRS